MPGLNLTGHRYPGDDGSADPAAAAALAAYATGSGGEHAALAALAAARLLVPIVAMAGEGASDLALPTVIGNDGRPALLAFTCLDSLRRWRPDARPVPVPAASVWQAGAQEASAVVIDIAGPVPFAVDGARLAALAQGRPPPALHEDPEVIALVRDALSGEEIIGGFRLLPARSGADLALHLTLRTAAGSARAHDAISRSVARVIAGAGGRLRRGIEVAITKAGRPW